MLKKWCNLFRFCTHFLRILDLLLLVSVLGKTGVNWVWLVNRVDGTNKNVAGQIIRKRQMRKMIHNPWKRLLTFLQDAGEERPRQQQISRWDMSDSSWTIKIISVKSIIRRSEEWMPNSKGKQVMYLVLFFQSCKESTANNQYKNWHNFILQCFNFQ